jgi:hypothetical protein
MLDIICYIIIGIALWLLIGLIGDLTFFFYFWYKQDTDRLEKLYSMKSILIFALLGPFTIFLFFYYLWINRPEAMEQREERKRQIRKIIDRM